jgi:hypothetical protein
MFLILAIVLGTATNRRLANRSLRAGFALPCARTVTIRAKFVAKSAEAA